MSLKPLDDCIVVKSSEAKQTKICVRPSSSPTRRRRSRAGRGPRRPGKLSRATASRIALDVKVGGTVL